MWFRYNIPTSVSVASIGCLALVKWNMASVSRVNTLGVLSLVCDIMFDLMKASNWLLKRLQTAFPLSTALTHKQTMPQGKQLETVGCGHRPRRLLHQFRPNIMVYFQMR